jgi:hypothetical protein
MDHPTLPPRPPGFTIATGSARFTIHPWTTARRLYMSTSRAIGSWASPRPWPGRKPWRSAPRMSQGTCRPPADIGTADLIDDASPA